MKSLLIAVLLGAVYAMASEVCQDLHAIKVQTQWKDAYGESSDRVALAQAVYRTLFKLAPESAAFFHRVNGEHPDSSEFVAFSLRVLNGLDIVITLLDQKEALHAQLEHLHHQHIDRHVPPKYAAAFVESLHHVLPAVIGHCYDEVAWTKCLGNIAKKILA
uniref:Extracellular globin n=1 Tax=Macrobdella decora TaxID=6405 RepID=Q760Q2_MACDE|nr:hemoglobin, chain IIA [Macrobdella decora]